MCNGIFVPTGRDLECHDHRTRTLRYLVDTSGFGIPTRRLYRDIGGHVYIQRAFDNAGHLKETKSNKIQCKMLPPDLNDRLTALCRDRLPEAFIFSGKRGAPYRPIYLTQLWKTAARKAEIPVPLYVGTRHSFATRRWEEIQRAGAEKLATEMGHGSAEMTFAHYVRTVPRLSPEESKPS